MNFRSWSANSIDHGQTAWTVLWSAIMQSAVLWSAVLWIAIMWSAVLWIVIMWSAMLWSCCVAVYCMMVCYINDCL